MVPLFCIFSLTSSPVWEMLLTSKPLVLPNTNWFLLKWVLKSFREKKLKIFLFLKSNTPPPSPCLLDHNKNLSFDQKASQNQFNAAWKGLVATLWIRKLPHPKIIYHFMYKLMMWNLQHGSFSKYQTVICKPPVKNETASPRWVGLMLSPTSPNWDWPFRLSWKGTVIRNSLVR